jgi:hypothetical protein
MVIVVMGFFPVMDYFCGLRVMRGKQQTATLWGMLGAVSAPVVLKLKLKLIAAQQTKVET